ncbi:MAG: manganese efflux pump, partial [Bacteroidota bacterium]
MTHINIILTYLFPFVIAAGYFSVCLSNTRSGKPLKSGISLKAALLFGASASAMLLAGYYAAGLLENRVEDAEKWVVMVMLLLIGYRMIMHGWRKRASVKVFDINLTSVILAMSFALGINGLFAGVALNFLDIP